jgi:hypothetical protein
VRRGLSEDLREVPARFISASFSGRRRTRSPDQGFGKRNPPGHRRTQCLTQPRYREEPPERGHPMIVFDDAGRGEHSPITVRTEIAVIALPTTIAHGDRSPRRSIRAPRTRTVHQEPGPDGPVCPAAGASPDRVVAARPLREHLPRTYLVIPNGSGKTKD